ncbi:uncharacterized protein LAJ45_01424 [Morchella importuna]|uniref:Argonaute siRNA chaperone complex subunit Arb1 n=1 Tax=Morchella conica CCBAS932 TaxID=1392247 RepID=A0A3N4KB81_9PEZI|nr:uncharacterized protein LAJ45_01424 [Morchella importuna]KAH8154892.1 hypothetical protein LAJ45_01424 [Morchella importuna]RPB07767.1 hypothetical protein P167DRAFT_529544 [Morchella conica CCBAS932]
MPLEDTAASALNASTKNGNLTAIAEELADGVNIAANGPKPTVEEQWQGPEGHDDKENGVVDVGEDDDANNATQVLEEDAPKKKKKKKRKPKSARKNPPPTGFEDNIVDGPFPPEIVSLENDLYSPSKSFAERIETCIQRYRAKRKFDPVRLQIFTSYLNLGGVSTGPKAYSGGVDPKNVDGLDAETIQAMAATEFVDKDDEDSEWEIDFEYVVKGFLSHRVPYVLGYMRFEDLELSAKVVRNFLNYIIYHNVAPEHNESIRSAIAITELGEKELILCRQVSARLPGKFNMACSTLYDGYYSGIKDESLTWSGGAHSDIGLTDFEAVQIVKACLEKRGAALQIETGPRMKLLKAEYLSLEVIGIVFAGTSGVKKPLPEHIQKDIDEGVIKPRPDIDEPIAVDISKKKYEPVGLNALGKLLVKVWCPEGPEETEWPDTDLDEFEIWLEMEVLQYCFVGMHLEAKVHTMSNGIIWIDSVTGVQCSFYLQLDSPDKESEDEFD